MESDQGLLRGAGLLLTYKCTAKCRHCETCSGPSKNGLMTADRARRYLSELKEIGVRAEGIHITGGEPFFYEELLFEVLHLVQDLFGPDSRPDIQTNAFWCTDDDTVKTKYQALKGLCGVVCASADPFHFEWVPIQRVRRSLNLAATAFGVHNPHFDSDLAGYVRTLRLSCREAIRMEGDYVQYIGNAAFSLAPFVEGYPPEDFSRFSCSEPLLGYDSVHIDPYGNVIPGCDCYGIILGNLDRGACDLASIIERSKRGNLGNPVIDILRRGPIKRLPFTKLNTPPGRGDGPVALPVHHRAIRINRSISRMT